MSGLLLCITLIVSIVALETLWVHSARSHGNNEKVDYRFALDLRSASVAELQLIPGFGETLSVRWFQERQQLLQTYPTALDAIANMRGVGKQKLSIIKQFVVPEQTKTATSDSTSRVALVSE